MVAHVAVIFREGDAGVNRRLTGGDRHVRGVGDEGGAVGHGTAGFRIDQAGEFLEHLGHLVAALAAADIDDDVGVAPFGELVLGHGLAGAETAGNRRRTALCQGKHGVQNPLPRDQRLGGRKTLGDGTGYADGPFLRHGQLPLRSVDQLHGDQLLADGVGAVRNHLQDISLHVRRNHHLVGNGPGLRDLGDDGAGEHPVALFHRHMGFPFFIRVQALHADAAADIVAAGLGDLV